MGKAVILIVDDEQEILNMLSRFLKRRGHKVFTAGNITEGKDQMRTANPDFLFLDVNLPDGNGLQAVPEFIQLNPQMNVILMSAFSDSGMQVLAKKKGAKAFLSKPFSLEAINQLIE
ncbi:MAG: response regulator [Lunatimonas sp.]|uniref:response regulator n=1 Tax=Lunatimonas sp. TaxID=2060141 RepID=UPI00263AC32A|nr:response regulator [Lunatimonas sp.]MCC5937411.1 response regulator [Lunatimonas sp.]